MITSDTNTAISITTITTTTATAMTTITATGSTAVVLGILDSALSPPSPNNSATTTTTTTTNAEGPNTTPLPYTPTTTAAPPTLIPNDDNDIDKDNETMSIFHRIFLHHHHHRRRDSDDDGDDDDYHSYGDEGTVWHVLSFLDAPSMGSVRHVCRTLRRHLTTTRCILTWLQQPQQGQGQHASLSSLHFMAGMMSLELRALHHRYEYWDRRGLVRRAVETGIDPTYRLYTQQQQQQQQQRHPTEGYCYYYYYYSFDTARAEQWLLDHSHTMEGSLSSNDFIVFPNANNDATTTTTTTIHPNNNDLLPYHLQLGPRWLVNVYFEPHLTTLEQGLNKAGLILDRFAFGGDKELDKKRDFVLALIRRLVVKNGTKEDNDDGSASSPDPQHDVFFLYGSISSVWRDADGHIEKRQQTLVLQFQTAEGNHPVELILRLSKTFDPSFWEVERPPPPRIPDEEVERRIRAGVYGTDE
eukprot:scaffold1982_cov93-Amphora_coffeaeformis.AAC.2